MVQQVAGSGELYRLLKNALDAGRSGVLCTLVEAARSGLAGRKIYLTPGPQGELASELQPGSMQDFITQEAQRALAAKEPALVTWDPGGPDQARVFIDVYLPPPSIIICGGGHIALPLVALAGLLGYEARVIDDRPSFASRTRFPQAKEVLCLPFDEGLGSVPIGPTTSVVIVTRGHKHDESCLRRVCETQAGYIGMIGSRRRVRTVMDSLMEDGLDASALERVHAPIGLDIGAETPEEIALSILAEITLIRRGGGGKPLSGERRPSEGPGAPTETVAEERSEKNTC